jgi:hypothetical protein
LAVCETWHQETDRPEACQTPTERDSRQLGDEAVANAIEWFSRIDILFDKPLHQRGLHQRASVCTVDIFAIAMDY